jgi:hypothetical protein
MPEQFPKADVPASNNSTGPPTTPSGDLTAHIVNSDVVVKPAESHVVSDKPADNIQK